MAKLEESRRLLLLRLRQHNGQELELVQEAMAFVEGPVKKANDVPQTHHIHPVFPSIHSGSPVLTASKGHKFKPSPAKKLEDRPSFNDSHFLADDLSPHSQAVNCKIRSDEGRNPMSGRLSKVFSRMLSFTGKTLSVVASVAAFLVVSELNLKSKNVSMRGPSQTSPQPVPVPVPEPKLEEKLDLKPILEHPVGYKRIEDDDTVKCIVNERVELLFPLGVGTRDILYGRG